MASETEQLNKSVYEQLCSPLNGSKTAINTQKEKWGKQQNTNMATASVADIV